MSILANLLALPFVANTNFHAGSLASNMTVDVLNQHSHYISLSKCPTAHKCHRLAAVLGLANAWTPDTRTLEDRHWRMATPDRLV